MRKRKTRRLDWLGGKLEEMVSKEEKSGHNDLRYGAECRGKCQDISFLIVLLSEARCMLYICCKEEGALSLEYCATG